MKIFLGFLGGFVLAGIAAGAVWYVMNNKIDALQASLDNATLQATSNETKAKELQSALDTYTHIEVQNAENLTKFISLGEKDEGMDSVYAEDVTVYAQGEEFASISAYTNFVKKQNVSAVTKSVVVDTPISFSKDNWSVLVQKIETPKILSFSPQSSSGSSSSSKVQKPSSIQKEVSYKLVLLHWDPEFVDYRFDFDFSGNPEDIDFQKLMQKVTNTMNLQSEDMSQEEETSSSGETLSEDTSVEKVLMERKNKVEESSATGTKVKN